MAKKSLSWYYHRLRAMGAQELFARAVFEIRKTTWRNRKEWIAPSPKFQNKDVWTPGLPFSEVGQERVLVLAEAETYLDHKFTLLNVGFKEEHIDWHVDPETGTRSPTTFGLDINYRDRNVAGNVKNIWELNRHHHLTLLAVAFTLTRDQRYIEEIERQLTSWIDANPFPLGVNWQSSLEAATRLISWVWIERLIRETPSHEKLFGENGTLWPSIYWHQYFIYHHRSYGSSSNNHLVGELAGLFLAASIWPYFDDSAHWEKVARKGLEKEVERQTFPSGLNREMAFSYHIYSSELFLLAALEAERLTAAFSKNYLNWIKRMIEVVPNLIDVGGNLPRYGDEDGGRAVHLRPFASSRLEWLYWLGAHVAEASIPKLEGDTSLLAATVGLPRDVPARSTKYQVKTDPIALEDAGLYVLTQNRGTEKEIFSIVDAGPLGFLSIAAHGHADGLAFTLSVGGVPIIVDAGTFSYFAGEDERNYFRGTQAHNTITIDNVDQSVSGGPFLWNQKATTRILKWQNNPNEIEFSAEHDGYQRLNGKIIHRRKLLLKDRQLTINDTLKGSGKHALEWRLHFHPDIEAVLKDGICRLTWKSGSLEIELDSVLQWRLLRGQKKEGGWYSPEFNVKTPAPTLVGHIKTTLPLNLGNSIKISS